MNASDIIRLLNSNHYAPADLDEVEKICRDFPEFSTAHLLKVRIMEALGYEKAQQLKVAAVYSMNRKKLHQLVTEVKHATETETESESPDDGPGLIQFSEESNEHADVIIEQHAPYAGSEPDVDLLELDEEPEDELLEIVDEEAAEISAEEPLEETTGESTELPAEEPAEEPGEVSAEEATELPAEEPGEVSAEAADEDVQDDELEDSDAIITSLEKEDTDMEEPETMTEDVPAIDQVDKAQDNHSDHLITSFLRGEPGPIRADKETSLKGDVSLASIREHDGFITDTLAQIYVKQGLFAKAIYAYEKLSLKYPEKSAYFAAQIEKIRNINHS